MKIMIFWRVQQPRYMDQYPRYKEHHALWLSDGASADFAAAVDHARSIANQEHPRTENVRVVGYGPGDDMTEIPVSAWEVK